MTLNVAISFSTTHSGLFLLKVYANAIPILVCMLEAVCASQRMLGLDEVVICIVVIASANVK